jgi:type III restriction enzyme
MKFTLKDYQEDAVRDVLTNLQKAAKRWHEDGDIHAFSLTATTGAGKTVMAGAVFEALFFGNDELDIDADPGAVVIWFSDDPSLNEQSRFRLMEASDRLTVSDLLVVDNSLIQERFDPGKVYFLNTQKLSKSSLLVRGHDPDDSGIERNGQRALMPDLRSFTIWDTIQKTIEDPELTLYLVLDEAHRGMGSSNGKGRGEKSTIVKRLINGSGAVPGIPIVWGISATVERFNAAISDMKNRATLPNVVVDSGKVQESGLLKDTIILDVPNEVGQFDTVLVRRGIDKLREMSGVWETYAEEQGDKEPVLPLMVLQVPNTPDPNEIGRAIDTIHERWPDLPDEAVAHVFGDHAKQTFGGHVVPYIPPERVQESTWVRVLIAKDAISTGWDCPRAEVMVSFRPAKDRTHITQLLGRMVRTPLARRIPGHQRLNAVDCLLPFFDAKSVKEVATALMSGGDTSDGGDEIPGRRVLINPEEMKPNSAVPDAVWETLVNLPSQALPKKNVRPVLRLTSLAHELSADGLLEDAGKTAHTEMHKVLDAAQERYKDEIAKARSAVLTMEGKSLTTDLEGKEMTFNDFVEAADYNVIADAYRRAERAVSKDLARTYAEHIAEKTVPRTADESSREEALLDARATVAALALVPDVSSYLDSEAEKLATKWLTDYRVDIRGLTDERQDIYRSIREMSAHPMEVDLAQPSSWMQPTTAREADGTETPLPRYEKHLLSDENGTFPEDFNEWEKDVLNTELSRSDVVAWYRNPSRASQDSLGILYQDGGQDKIVRPDFVFFAKRADGSIVPDIVDPHGTQFADAIPKLKGLAKYAEEHGAKYRRIDAVAKVGDNYRVLDLQEESVRSAVESATSVTELYGSGVAADYTIKN